MTSLFGAVREWMHRLLGSLRGGRTDEDLADELRAHEALAADDAHARQAPDASRRLRSRRTVDSALESLRDQRGLPWLDALKSDAIFGWRQILRHRTASTIAVLSLGLSIGATATAFRLTDAILLRSLPVADPDSLYFAQLTFVESSDTREDFDYPSYREFRDLLNDKADVMVLGSSHPVDASVEHGLSERFLLQYVSGNVFPQFGLNPAAGRLLGPADDDKPGAHPVAVLSHNCWTQRFARDPRVVGSTIVINGDPFEVVGVAPSGFIGTEPGLVPDVFVPATMNTEALDAHGWSWFSLWLRPRPGVEPDTVRQMMQAAFDRGQRARVRDFSSDTPKAAIDRFLAQRIRLQPAGHGVSPIQKHLATPLAILMALVLLVLMMACATVGNLLTGQAVARAREMALRVSIGAGRARLMQLVMVESAMLALAASALGAAIAAWAAPAVVGMIHPIEIPIYLVFGFDWHTAAFGVGLAVFVTALFGFTPALRASSVTPMLALKGGETIRSRRVIKTLLVLQMTLCAFVLFAAGLFRATFDRLSSQSFGLSYDHVLAVAAESRDTTHRAQRWQMVAEAARHLPGVESTAVAGWPLISSNRWTSTISGGDGGVEPREEQILGVSSGFFGTLRIPMIEGRDFREGDAAPALDEAERPVPGVGIVNESFVRRYFKGRSIVGRQVLMRRSKETDAPLTIVGVVRDTAYRHVREPMKPIVFVPMTGIGSGTMFVRTAGDPLALGPTIGRLFAREWPDARLRMIRPATDFIETQMVVERLLARLTSWFAMLALLLAGIGLYGVVNDAVIQRRREIGVRMALGARAPDIVRHVTMGALVLVVVGLVLGLGSGVAFGRVVGSLLFQVTPTEFGPLATPLAILAAVFTLASLSPSIRAVRTNPTETLRSD
jgi:predicted permease